MTRNKAHPVRSYPFQDGETILIDANVWLFLHPPPGDSGSGWAKDYSDAYRRLIAAKAKPVTDAMVLSEYLNRYFRIEYDAGWKEEFKTFKSFRMSARFPPVAEDAVAEVRQIVKLATVQDTPASRFSLDAILEGTEAGAVDFNDAV